MRAAPASVDHGPRLRASTLAQRVGGLRARAEVSPAGVGSPARYSVSAAAQGEIVAPSELLTHARREPASPRASASWDAQAARLRTTINAESISVNAVLCSEATSVDR
jgi:hypothetical protein